MWGENAAQPEPEESSDSEDDYHEDHHKMPYIPDKLPEEHKEMDRWREDLPAWQQFLMREYNYTDPNQNSVVGRTFLKLQDKIGVQGKHIEPVARSKWKCTRKQKSNGKDKSKSQKKELVGEGSNHESTTETGGVTV